MNDAEIKASREHIGPFYDYGRSYQKIVESKYRNFLAGCIREGKLAQRKLDGDPDIDGSDSYDNLRAAVDSGKRAWEECLIKYPKIIDDFKLADMSPEDRRAEIAKGEENARNQKAVDAWLAKVPEDKNLNQTMKIYAPTCHGRCIADVERLQDIANKAFGGSTIYDAEGCWFDPYAAKMDCEPIKVIEVGHSYADKKTVRMLMSAIVEYAVNADQQAISIKNNEFHIAKTVNMTRRMEAAK